MKSLSKLVVFHPRLVVITAFILTILAAITVGVRGVSFDGSLETLSQADADLSFHREIARTFGGDRVIVVGVTTGEVLTSDFIAKLGRLSSRLASVPGVAEVQSLTTVKTVRMVSGGISVERLIPPGATDDQLRALQHEVTRDPLYARNYISTDGRTAGLSVFIAPRDVAHARSLADQIEDICREVMAGYELLLAGAPIMDVRGIRSMARDMVVCSPLAGLLCLIVFFLAFRSFWGALLPLLTLLMGLIWVVALVSLLDRPVTIATVSSPTVLIAVGASFIFHLLNQYRLTTTAGEPWASGMAFIAPGIAVSGLTAIAGFGALGWSSIPTVRDMGLFNAAGVFVVLLLSLTFVPAVLVLLPTNSMGRAVADRGDRGRGLDKLLRQLTAIVLFKSRVIWLGVVAIALGSGLGILGLQVNTDYLRIFPRSSDTVQSAEKLHERLSGAALIQVVVAGPPGALFEPRFHSDLKNLKQFALAQPGVDFGISIADIVERLAGPLYGQTEPTVPDSRAKIETIFRDFLSGEESLSRIAIEDAGGSKAVLILRTHLFRSNELKLLTGRIDQWARNHLPPGFSARSTGPTVLLTNASDALARSQSHSLGLALATIYTMMAILFRSLLLALVALIPNLLPIAGFFGFLGWSGIPLDITTSLVASAALGLAVDNAVHMVRRYQQSSAKTRDEGWVMWLTMLGSGKPLILANATLMAAFLIFTLSSFVPVRTGGLLWAITIGGCLVANLLVLPAMLKRRWFASSRSSEAVAIASST